MATVRARPVFIDDKIAVTTIESVRFQTDRTNRPRYVTCSLTPIAVIVREQDRTYALDLDAQPIDIDQLDLPADLEL